MKIKNSTPDVIKISRELNIDSIVNNFIYDIEKFWDKKGRKVILDLSKTEFITTAGLCILSAFFKYCLKTQIISRGKIITPSDSNVHEYLTKMKFYDNLNITLKKEFYKQKGYASYMELEEVEDEDKISLITEKLVNILNTKNVLEERHLSTLKFSIGEILGNIFHHAYSPINGIVCAQYFPRKNIVEISIADCGIGFSGSLIKKSEYSDIESDELYIKKALEFGVSSVPDTRNSGEGLSWVNACVKENKNGKISIISGRGLYQNNLTKKIPKWNGSLIDLRFDLDNIIPINEIIKIIIKNE